MQELYLLLSFLKRNYEMVSWNILLSRIPTFDSIGLQFYRRLSWVPFILCLFSFTILQMIHCGICKKEAKKAHLIFEIRQDFVFHGTNVWLQLVKSSGTSMAIQTKFVGPSVQTSKWSSYKFHKHILFGIYQGC